MQRPFVLAILIALLMLAPSATLFAQDVDGSDDLVGDLFAQMTQEERNLFEEYAKEMYYLIYEVQARVLAQQESAPEVPEDVFTIYSLEIVPAEKDLALEPPPVFDEDSLRNIIF